VNPFQGSYAGGCGVEADGDGFVAKVNAAGTSLIYSTYLGGSGSESAVGIAIDAVGSAHVTGHTFSADFPIHDPLKSALTGGLDAFITKLNPDGSALAWSTYLGGSASEGQPSPLPGAEVSTQQISRIPTTSPQPRAPSKLRWLATSTGSW
jgi:hypothetical protein